MDPINPIAGNPESMNQSDAPTQPTNTPVKKDANTFAVVTVAIFIIFSLSVVAFLYYQNQQLKNIVLDYQNKLNNSPTPTIQDQPTTILEASPSATPTLKPKTATQSATPKSTILPTPIY